MPHDGSRPSRGGSNRSPARSLRALFEHIASSQAGELPDLEIAAIRADSQQVRDGDLFVALKGTQTDGHDYLEDAVANGAVAVVVEELPSRPLNVPVIRTASTRSALAELAAAWHGYPARDMTAVGITGTVGKTSVLAMIERIMAKQGEGIGTVGSLGVHLDGRTLSETGFTAPDPLLLHEKLAELRDAGCRLLVMEVTSHALVQRRFHGVRLAMGIFTNLLPLEHQDYHGTFADYVAAKLLFFDLLPAGAPVVYNADDRAVDTIVQDREVRAVGTGTREAAAIQIQDAQTRASGTSLTLRVRDEVRTISDTAISPLTVDIQLQLLGRSNVYNCAVAAATALMLDAPPEAVKHALESLPAPPRRVQMIYDEEFQVVDDTVGHPDSVSALFEAVQALDPHRIHIAFAIRGSRGPRINRNTADALGIWVQRMPVTTLALTRSEDTADERNQVSDEERDAFVERLDAANVSYLEHPRLSAAVESVLSAAEKGDLVLLLGAQGMDAGAEIALNQIRRSSD